MNKSMFPILQTDRLLLRELQTDDAEAIYGIMSNAEVMKYYDLEPFENIEQAHKLIQRYKQRYNKGEAIRWVIVLGNQVIGTCGFFWDRHDYAAEIGFELSKNYWNQGIMSEALRTIIKYGFEKESINRIEAQVFSENTASQNLLQKLAFNQEGILREKFYLHDKFYDLLCFALLKKDYYNGLKES
jgi:ribosomal-protein-alanine N-acetyltransferase